MCVAILEEEGNFSSILACFQYEFLHVGVEAFLYRYELVYKLLSDEFCSSYISLVVFVMRFLC